LNVPRRADGLVLLLQARGNPAPTVLRRGIAPVLQSARLATCVVDLVLAEEAGHPALLPGLDLLTERVGNAVECLRRDRAVGHFPLGIVAVGAATAAAVRLAAERPSSIRALVACCGRPDLAAVDPVGLRTAVLLLMPGDGRTLVASNREFCLQMESEALLVGSVSRPGESESLLAFQNLIRTWCTVHLRRSRRLRSGRRRKLLDHGYQPP
jgi:hypothetical protein